MIEDKGNHIQHAPKIDLVAAMVCIDPQAAVKGRSLNWLIKVFTKPFWIRSLHNVGPLDLFLLLPRPDDVEVS
jgi:hypothetical protein